VLRALGGGSLSLGRLYEGHVNAVALVARYGTIEQLGVLAGPPGTGALLAVWNTDDGREPLRLVAERDGWRLIGCKVLCSGAGFIERPLVTARDESGRFLMVVPRLRRGERADLAAWTPTGMQASATGRVDFTGLHVTDGDIVGDDDDYHRQPAFSGGAWRFLAVQLGAMETVLDLCRRQHTNTGRGKDPHQAARFGQAAIAVETARLWSERAAFLAEVSNKDAEATVAYVNLARLAVERAALDLMELVQRSIGLSSFIRPHPIERVIRDLSTYLRQPAPDRALVGAAEWVLNCARAAPDIWP
jgi:alkylation response protein AidB-like acyl-CoA dehydrogenase